MEASSIILLDQSFRKKNAFNGEGPHTSFFLGSSTQQQLLHIQGACDYAGFMGPRPPPYSFCPLPAPTHSSLPPSRLLQRPNYPLLPLPVCKFSSLPSAPGSTRRMLGAAPARSANKGPKKPRASPVSSKREQPKQGLRKEPAAASPRVNVPKPAAGTATPAVKDGSPGEEGLVGDVYSLSPPPSSLPIPKFFLRERTPLPPSPPLTPCNTEALGGNVTRGGGVDAGASDDLRRLLRL